MYFQLTKIMQGSVEGNMSALESSSVADPGMIQWTVKYINYLRKSVITSLNLAPGARLHLTRRPHYGEIILFSNIICGRKRIISVTIDIYGSSLSFDLCKSTIFYQDFAHGNLNVFVTIFLWFCSRERVKYKNEKRRKNK